MLIQQPVYYPFEGIIRDSGRQMITNTLYLGEDNRYHIDFEDLEAKLCAHRVKLFLFCSPHNPVSRVWTKEELIRLGDLCMQHQVIVVSDEIHADFAFQGKHHVFATLKQEYAQRCVICTSPSKTFNLAGLNLSNIFIPNGELRERFRSCVNAVGVNELNVMGQVACEAAYRQGEEWYQAMMRYVADNISFIGQYVEENLPGCAWWHMRAPIWCGWILGSLVCLRQRWSKESSTRRSCGWTAAGCLARAEQAFSVSMPPARDGFCGRRWIGYGACSKSIWIFLCMGTLR